MEDPKYFKFFIRLLLYSCLFYLWAYFLFMELKNPRSLWTVLVAVLFTVINFSLMLRAGRKMREE